MKQRQNLRFCCILYVKFNKYCNNNIIYVLIDSELSQMLEIYMFQYCSLRFLS